MSAIEYAGGVTLEQATRSGVLSRAPQWWRDLAARAGSPTASPAKPAPTMPVARQNRPPVIGWIAGVACPGVSRPVAFSHRDGERLPEQFTRDCLRSMAESAFDDGVDVVLGHGGPVIASSRSIDVVFHHHRIVGLMFEVRVRDTDTGRQVLDAIDTKGIGVSIGFTERSSWITDRDGVGRVRVVDGAKLHHIALLPRSGTASAVFAGARAFGKRDKGLGCPQELLRDARQFAFALLKQQAGCRG